MAVNADETETSVKERDGSQTWGQTAKKDGGIYV